MKTSEAKTEVAPQNLTPGFGEEQISELCGEFDSVLLYGSCARGDAGSKSDIDLLVISDQHHKFSGIPEKVSITVYKPDHLRTMVRRGSLFALHLREESKILVDRAGIIPGILAEWRAPDFERLFEGIAAAASVLEVANNCVPIASLKRPALFVLRSALYATCAKRRTPAFAMTRVRQILNEPAISQIFGDDGSLPDKEIFELARNLLRKYVHRPLLETEGGLDSLAVAWCRVYPMAAYLALQLLLGEREIGYATAPVDWVS